MFLRISERCPSNWIITSPHYVKIGTTRAMGHSGGLAATDSKVLPERWIDWRDYSWTSWTAVHSEGVSRAGSVTVTVGVSDMWQVTCDTRHVTCDMWHLTCGTRQLTPDTWHLHYKYIFFYWWFYSHTLRDSVFPVHKIIFLHLIAHYRACNLHEFLLNWQIYFGFHVCQSDTNLSFIILLVWRCGQ